MQWTFWLTVKTRIHFKSFWWPVVVAKAPYGWFWRWQSILKNDKCAKNTWQTSSKFEKTGKKITRITLQGIGTGVHLDVSLNVGHDDPPQLGDKVTLLVLVLVPLFVLHLPGGAEHDPQADQLLTWMKIYIYIYKSNTVEPLLWDTSFQGRRHYFWVPQRALEFDFLDEVFGQWMLFVPNWGVIQRKFI